MRGNEGVERRKTLNGVKFFPRRLSFPKLCNILVGYLNAGADKKYVGVSAVVERSNVTLHNISRNNNFLRSWGFVDESEQEPGKYLLGRDAAEFAYAYRINPHGERTRELLKKVLSKDEVLAKFIERIGRENLDRDAVLIELPRVIGDLRADKVGLNAFLDMVAYAFQIEEISEPSRTTRPSREPQKTARPTRKTTAALPRIQASSPSASISINLTINPEISPEKLKEYIKAMLEAYDEHTKEK
ncbi:MAG: hypothetical protein NWF14_03600 [Candidatus Bathyarchaeota archaeon]|nr:hypothetical protein [Candidatus Bathyarchaeota archaeon]